MVSVHSSVDRDVCSVQISDTHTALRYSKVN